MKSHGAFDAAAIGQRAHRRATAEVRDYHPALCNLRRDLAQTLRNILVGKAVKTITAYAFLIKTLRKRVVIRQGAMAAMKRRVEACNLRQLRTAGEKCADRGEIVRLVQRRQRNVTFELRDDGRGDPYRKAIFGASVNHAVPDGHKIDLLSLPQPVARFLRRRRKVRNFLSRIGLIDQ